MNAFLLKSKKLLEQDYFVYQPDDNVLVISNDKTELPFMKIIWDENYPHNLLLSFATDFPLSSLASSLTLQLNNIKEVKLLEDYYIAKNGNMYFGDEAAKFYMWDTQISLDDVDPECQNMH